MFKIRQTLDRRGLLLLEHGTGWKVTNEGSAKYLIEYLFDDLDAVEKWVNELPNRLMELECEVFDKAFEDFVNQCDGCRRKLPLNEYGIHVGEGYDMIACTAKRYVRQAEDRCHRVGHKETPVHYLHAHQIIEGWPKWKQRIKMFWPKGTGK